MHVAHKIHSDTSIRVLCCGPVTGWQCDCFMIDLPMFNSVSRTTRDKDKSRNLVSPVTFTGNESCRLISCNLEHVKINCLQFNEVLACLKIRTILKYLHKHLNDCLLQTSCVTLKRLFFNCNIVYYIECIGRVLF